MQPGRVTSCCRAAAEFSCEVMHGRVADDGSRRVTFDQAVAQSPGWVAGEFARPQPGRLTDVDAGSGIELSRSAVLAGWQCHQGGELGLVQGDVGRCGVGGELRSVSAPTIVEATAGG
jgi:hypothetical protein